MPLRYCLAVTLLAVSACKAPSAPMSDPLGLPATRSMDSVRFDAALEVRDGVTNPVVRVVNISNRAIAMMTEENCALIVQLYRQSSTQGVEIDWDSRNDSSVGCVGAILLQLKPGESYSLRGWLPKGGDVAGGDYWVAVWVARIQELQPMSAGKVRLE